MKNQKAPSFVFSFSNLESSGESKNYRFISYFVSVFIIFVISWAFYSNSREPLSLHLLMFTTDLLDCTSGSWKISHFLHFTKETFPVRLNESKSGCLRKSNTLYLPYWVAFVGSSMLITFGSIIHLIRFGSDMRLTTFDFVQCLRPDFCTREKVRNSKVKTLSTT